MRILLLFCLLFGYNTASSCSCFFAGGFMESIQSKKNAIAVASIVKHEEIFTYVSIKKVIRGNLSSDTVQILKGNGANCWEAFSENDFGSYVLLLTDISEDKMRSYGLSSCGTSLLELVGEKVRGSIAGFGNEKHEIYLSDLIEIIQKKYPTKLYNITDLISKQTMQINGNGDRVGKWQMRGYSSCLKEEGEYDSNFKKNGEWKQYHIKGNKTAKGDYKFTSVLSTTYHYSHGKLMEVTECYNENGQALDFGAIKEGNGILKEYHYSGTLKGEYTFKDGIKQGPAKEYDANRTNEGNYKNGERDGTWKSYWDGKLNSKVVYKAGKEIKTIWLED